MGHLPEYAPVVDQRIPHDRFVVLSLTQHVPQRALSQHSRSDPKAVGDGREARELVARWLGCADAQEARLEALREARRQSEAERRALREEVDAVVRSLESERRVGGAYPKNR